MGCHFPRNTWSVLRETDLTRPPDNRATIVGRVLSRDRLSLFFKVTYFFLLLFPLRMAVILTNALPGVRGTDLFGSVFTYLSSVQMYQQRPGVKGGTVADLGQSRRISIQRRFANAVVDMAERGYDRWYVMAHSLGSVIALKGLMYPDDSFANFMSFDRFSSKSMRFRCDARSDCAYPDKPRRPVWLSEKDALDTSILLRQCAGLITWGSPLETFAKTWPGMVHLRRKRILPENFESINLFDYADIISSPLRSFDFKECAITPINVSCRSSAWIFAAHTSYFRVPKRRANGSIGAATLLWIMDGTVKFDKICERTGTETVKGMRKAGRLAVAGLQWLLALVIGLFSGLLLRG